MRPRLLYLSEIQPSKFFWPPEHGPPLASPESDFELSSALKKYPSQVDPDNLPTPTRCETPHFFFFFVK